MARAFGTSQGRGKRTVDNVLKVLEYLFGCQCLTTGILYGMWARISWYAGELSALLGLDFSNLNFFEHLLFLIKRGCFYCFAYLQLEVGIMDIFNPWMQITCCETLFLRVYVRLRHLLNMIFDQPLEKPIFIWENDSDLVRETLRQLLIHCDFVLQ